MKLTETKQGQKVKIVDVNAPLFLRRRIFDLGFSPSTVVFVYAMQRKGIGGVYAVRGAVLGVDKKIAKNILVEPI